MFKETSFKDITILSSSSFCSMEQTILCNFGEGHCDEHFCETIMNLDQWLTRCPLKIFNSQQNCLNSGSLFECDQLPIILFCCFQ